MNFVGLLLALFGLGWLFLILVISILGGRLLVEVKNPFTKNMESITDITIEHKNKNPV